MNIRKKLLALLMIVVMAVTYMPVMVYAAEGAAEEVVPVSAEPLMVDHIRGEVGTDIIKHSGYSGFMVTYSDGTTVDYQYKEGKYKDSYGETSRYSGYYKDGVVTDDETKCLYAFAYSDEKFQLALKEGWNKNVRLVLKVPSWTKDSSGNITKYYTTQLDAYVDIWCDARTPKKVDFEPADGFKPEGLIGYNIIDESYFYGEGNSFVITSDFLSYDPIEDKYGKVEVPLIYKYVNSPDAEEGFYENGDPENERFVFPADVPMVWLDKGDNIVEIPYTGYADGSSEPIDLTFKVTVTAQKMNAYSIDPIFEYTGKAVSKAAFAKKLKVKDSYDKTIPSSAYTYTWKSRKKIGWYEVTIRFKDTSKYVDSITAGFYIGPKTPKITKVTGGKKQLTVTWKKFTKAQLKNIDGMYIEVAQNKNFTKGYKIFTVSKKALKSSSRKTIKKLAGGKKYYVRLCTYRKVKQNGEKYYINSNDSKAKTVKTKK